MTDQGSIGFLDEAHTEGRGLIYPADGFNLLYVGGLWVSQGDTYIANDTESGPDETREEQIEGITREDATFGGGNDDDSSGSMTYVSIRYGGYGLQENEEINGLTMGAVGCATTLHHIEVVNNVDDGFEWFGGTVNSK